MFKISSISSRIAATFAAALFCLFGPALTGGQQVWAGSTYCFLYVELTSENLTYGGTFAATVTVRPNSTADWSGNIGSGTVTFRIEDGADLGTTTLTQDGTEFKGSFSFNTPSPGTYGLEALYSGDDELIDCSTMQSETFQDIKVTKATPSPVVSQSASESSLGSAVTFTVEAASVGSSFSAPTGKVTFYADGVRLGSASVTDGKASISTSKLAKGDHTISARIASDTNYKAADSNEITHSVIDAEYQIQALPETAPKGKIGSSYSLQFRGAGGVAPYTISKTSGSLPKGLSFSASGLVSGTPQQTGDYPITVNVVDANGVADDVSVTISINEDVITALPETAPAGKVGEAYKLQFRAKGGVAPYSFKLTGGQLPKGLTFSSSGLVSGEPEKQGDFPITVRARDVNGVTDDVSVVIVVSNGKIVVNPSVAPSGDLGTPYVLQFYGTGGQAPYSFELVGGALPKGLSMNKSGKVSGSPLETGSFPIEVRGTDKNGLRDRTKVTIVIDRTSNTDDLAGILEAERRAARRLGENQIDAVLGRLSALHGSECMTSSLSMNVNGGSLSKSNADTVCAEDYAAWFNGNYSIGERDEHGRQPELDYGTAGLTAGIDRRLSEALIVGASIGMGLDETDIGDMGSRSEGKAFSIAGYGSYMFAEQSFLDAVVGYNKLDFSARRFVSDDVYARYDRDGDQLFAATSISTIADIGAIKATPYGRLKITATHLDQTQEYGAGADNLTYQSSSDFTSTASVGMTLEKTYSVEFGSITPFVTLEYQRELSGDATQDAYYTSDADSTLSADLDTVADNLATAQIGARFAFGDQSSLNLSYRGSSDFSNNWMQSVFGQLSVRF
ncbi:autotransporter domain-containing protein [Rhizobium sp. FKL33]|uniref:autotransporter family protein n=1 Tax=Rhizobium sp. FKL33 TaxID=2562307 RepID=UPI00148561B2|nr:autotransporter domain-containing protein [Rhizobium sp. FKL33]